MNWLAHRYTYDAEDIEDSNPRGVLTLVGGKS
jgi:hypothetical protein